MYEAIMPEGFRVTRSSRGREVGVGELVSKTLLRRYGFLAEEGEKIHDDTDVVMPARDAKRFYRTATALAAAREERDKWMKASVTDAAKLTEARKEIGRLQALAAELNRDVLTNIADYITYTEESEDREEFKK